ncbi:IS21 family transposase, partial [Bacteroides caecigallinarum]|nr:IS21 family transposase [Bacteroides caecigallinarum]
DVIRRIFYSSTMPPETHYKTCDGLLNLQRSSDPAVFQKACETALNVDRCSYRFIRSLVESKCAGVGQPTSSFAPPQHCNIRGKSQFK